MSQLEVVVSLLSGDRIAETMVEGYDVYKERFKESVEIHLHTKTPIRSSDTLIVYVRAYGEGGVLFHDTLPLDPAFLAPSVSGHRTRTSDDGAFKITLQTPKKTPPYISSIELLFSRSRGARIYGLALEGRLAAIKIEEAERSVARWKTRLCEIGTALAEQQANHL